MLRATLQHHVFMFCAVGGVLERLVCGYGKLAGGYRTCFRVRCVLVLNAYAVAIVPSQGTFVVARTTLLRRGHGSSSVIAVRYCSPRFSLRQGSRRPRRELPGDPRYLGRGSPLDARFGGSSPLEPEQGSPQRATLLGVLPLGLREVDFGEASHVVVCI